MNTVVNILKDKHPGAVQRSWQESGRMTCVLIAPGAVVQLVGFLVRTIEMRFVFLFASDERRGSAGCFQIRYVFSYVHQDQFLILVMNVDEKDKTFPSITPWMPQANWQEREIQDLFGLKAAAHPDPRPLVLHEDWPQGYYPLRKDFAPGKIPRVKGEAVFERVEGEGVFEIPVGPVHAGIIEPGHFRFSSAGESILKLEIRHFYKHKGIEKSGEGRRPGHLLCLAERISGDNSAAHAAASAQALEALAGIDIPRRAKFLRVAVLELERAVCHLADITGIVLDVAFAFGSAQLARIRERLMRLNERLTGSRLLRSSIVFGGVLKDFSAGQKKFLAEEMQAVKKDLDETFQVLANVSSLQDRIVGTGILKKEIVEALGGTGPVARASGVDRDLRREHAYAAYQELLFMVPVFTDGDVASRLWVKVHEIYESFKLIHEALEVMPEGPVRIEPGPLAPLKGALGYVESPRGECFHWIATDGEGKIARWKIQSPSFANWPLIEYAVLENIIPDFPVINKSMNLSYAGNDR